MPRPASRRLVGWDYSTPAPYFFTVCTDRKAFLFDDDRFRSAVMDVWLGLTDHYPTLQLDAFVIMPNHIHGLLLLLEPESQGESAACLRQATTKRVSLPLVVNSPKSFSTRDINRLRRTPGAKVWQPGYWDHVVRSDEALDPIRSYILSNPANWETDPLNPACRSARDDDEFWERLIAGDMVWVPGELAKPL